MRSSLHRVSDPPGQAPLPELRDGDVVLRARPAPGAGAGDGPGVDFAVEVAGAEVGWAELRPTEPGAGRVTLFLAQQHRGSGVATRAGVLLLSYAYDVLGLVRVEAHVDQGDLRALRLAGRVGFRREGVMRSRGLTGDARRDTVLLARLASDPQPGTREAFFGMLNASLPRKRVIAQGVVRDGSGRVLLCEQTYKPEWDLPGGVVEPSESPRTAARREVLEELGLDLEPVRLLAVNWLPPWFAWDDACTFLFDLGQQPDGLRGRLALQPTEIRAVHWCDRSTVAHRASRATAVVLDRLWDRLWDPLGDSDGGPLYLEAGADPR